MDSDMVLEGWKRTDSAMPADAFLPKPFPRSLPECHWKPLNLKSSIVTCLAPGVAGVAGTEYLEVSHAAGALGTSSSSHPHESTKALGVVRNEVVV